MTPDKIVKSWDEWNDLSQKQREYSLFCILDAIDNKLISSEERFKKLENQKIFNKIGSFLGGVLGGILALLGKALLK